MTGKASSKHYLLVAAKRTVTVSKYSPALHEVTHERSPINLVKGISAQHSTRGRVTLQWWCITCLQRLMISDSCGEHSYEERVHNVERIVQQHKQPTIFEAFSAQVFHPASGPGMYLSLSSVFCCRAGSGYPYGYPVLMDILSWEIAEVVSTCLPCGLWSHISDPSGPVNPVNSCIFVAVLHFPVFCFYVLYFPVFLVDCTIVVVNLCFHYILLFSLALFRLLIKYNV